MVTWYMYVAVISSEIEPHVRILFSWPCCADCQCSFWLSNTMWDPWVDAPTITQVHDPPMTQGHNPAGSSSEDDDSDVTPPPAPNTGVSFQLPGTLQMRDLLESIFGRKATDPTLTRVLNQSGDVLHAVTTVASLETPRTLYIQFASFTEYTQAAALFQGFRHDPVLPRDQEIQQNLFSCRLFVHYLSVFRVLEHSRRVLSMQSVINDRLEDRVRDLEQIVANLQQQLQTSASATDNNPETAPEQPETEDAPDDIPLGSFWHFPCICPMLGHEKQNSSFTLLRFLRGVFAHSAIFYLSC